MHPPDPERQVQFVLNVRRLLSDGSFVATVHAAGNADVDRRMVSLVLNGDELVRRTLAAAAR